MSLHLPSPKLAMISAVAISSAAVIGVAAAASTAPAPHRATAAAPARPAISHGLKPAISSQGYDCATGTSSPFYCLGGENDSSQNGFTYGVYGVEGYAPNSTGGVGVLGYSGNSSVNNAYGVYGVTFSPKGIGVYGAGDGPAPASGSAPSSTTQSTGVVGDSHSGNGVFGSTEFPNASDVINSPVAGVYGLDNTSNGTDNNGVYGLTLNGGFGVAGVSSGNSTKSATGGVLGYATSGYGVAGSSSTSYGVFGQGYGSGNGNFGVVGISQTTDGVYGIATAADTFGVGGASTLGNGVGGSTANDAGYGVVGNNSANTNAHSGAGVMAESTATTALYATTATTTGDGADIVNTKGTGAAITAGTNAVVAQTTGTAASNTAVYAVVPSNGTGYAFYATNGSTIFSVDDKGNIYVAGTYTQIARTRDGLTAKSFGGRESTPSISDVGTAELVNGAAAVRLDPALIEQMDRSTPYHVFITPDGDTHGLFVASRTPAGFTVRENQGGRSTTAFEYRIVATVDGHAADRMSLSRAPQPAIAPPARNELLSAPRNVNVAIPLSKATMAFEAKMQHGYHAPVMPAALFHPQRNAQIESRAR